MYQRTVRILTPIALSTIFTSELHKLMRETSSATVQRQYPLLYWTTMAYIVGLPNFVHFDQTGRTTNQVNFSSISLVIQVVITGYVMVMMLLLDRRPIRVRRIRFDAGLWVALLLVFTLATLLEPASHSVPTTSLALFLSLFRLGQWVIAFVLIAALYSRAAPERATGLVVELIGRSSWIWLGMVWVLLPIVPAQVYGGSEDGGPDGVRRLGGQLIHPSHVALLGSIAFFYALFFFSRGPRKWISCLIALVTIGLTGARTQQAGFLLALLLYAVVLSRRPVVRWGMIGAATLALLLSVPLAGNVMQYIGRGQSAQTLASLDDRTRVWQVSFDAIGERPLLGYGYSVGARNAIRDHWTFGHWIPPHAHNEFIQAALDGGVVALVLMLCIYYRVLLASIRNAGNGIGQLFLFIVFVQFVLETLTGPELGYGYRGTGGVLVLCCVGVMSGATVKVRGYRAARVPTGTASTSPFGEYSALRQPRRATFGA